MPKHANQYTISGSANLHNHLVTQTQAAEMLNVSPRNVAAKLANIKRGDFCGNPKHNNQTANLQFDGVTQTQAAQQAGFVDGGKFRRANLHIYWRLKPLKLSKAWIPL